MPFKDRNTTLPFPTADTSKGAAIEAADIPVSRTRSRLGLSLHRKSQSQSKSGKLGSSNNAEGLKVGGEGGDGQNVVNENGIQLVEERDEQGYGPGERKKGILRKKQLHKV